MSGEPLIALRDVSKRFGGIQALRGVSFDVLPGSLHAIVGENGAGKSTLMKIIAGVIPDYEGELLLRGQRAQFASTRDAERAGIAIVHQELNLVEQLSAAANIFLGRELRGPLGLLDERRMQAKAAEILNDLECRVDPAREVGHLRVGDQQLVEIARALSQRSDVLILDEPTSALSEAEVARLDRVIARLRERGVTMLYISHKMSEVFRLADRITVLRDGQQVKTLDFNPYLCADQDRPLDRRRGAARPHHWWRNRLGRIAEGVAGDERADRGARSIRPVPRGANVLRRASRRGCCTAGERVPHPDGIEPIASACVQELRRWAIDALRRNDFHVGHDRTALSTVSACNGYSAATRSATACRRYCTTTSKLS